jgi:1-acyl-sn-glycerol-3-phosphate acyltransferase
VNGRYKAFERLVAETGGTYAFDGVTSVKGIGMILEIIKDMGLNPADTAQLRQGVTALFNVETANMPEWDKNRYILAPNHVSDMDAIIMGLLCPRTRIISKNDWTDNAELKRFLDLHYDVYGFERRSLQGLRGLVKDSAAYFNESAGPRHLLVFSQGTISDFNNNSPERISPVAAIIAEKAGVPVVNVFIEQASLHNPTRIVFDEPYKPLGNSEFIKTWLERERAMQEALCPPARRPVLSYKHMNNNKPGDEFF